MQESRTARHESIASELIEDINQIESIALGEGAGTCQACGEHIPEGSPITAYAFRPADRPRWQVGHATCDQDGPLRMEACTLGVRELLVDGRIGTVSDQATQSHWRVLLALRVRAVSPAETTEVIDGRDLPAHTGTSRLARAAEPPAESRDSRATAWKGDDSMAQTTPSHRGAREAAETVSGPSQRTLQECFADATGEGAH